MSREEANRLSSLRRDELRKNEELERNKLLKIRNMLRVSYQHFFLNILTSLTQFESGFLLIITFFFLNLCL